MGMGIRHTHCTETQECHSSSRVLGNQNTDGKTWMMFIQEQMPGWRLTIKEMVIYE
jgi:hypothetical protein